MTTQVTKKERIELSRFIIKPTATLGEMIYLGRQLVALGCTPERAAKACVRTPSHVLLCLSLPLPEYSKWYAAATLERTDLEVLTIGALAAFTACLTRT